MSFQIQIMAVGTELFHFTENYLQFVKKNTSIIAFLYSPDLLYRILFFQIWYMLFNLCLKTIVFNYNFNNIAFLELIQGLARFVLIYSCHFLSSGLWLIKRLKSSQCFFRTELHDENILFALKGT